MKPYIDKISELINSMGIRHDIHSFDSGAFMIDVWAKKGFYCVQLFNNKFGISQVTDKIDFSTIPDKTYTEWESFKKELEKVINE